MSEERPTPGHEHLAADSSAGPNSIQLSTALALLRAVNCMALIVGLGGPGKISEKAARKTARHQQMTAPGQALRHGPVPAAAGAAGAGRVGAKRAVGRRVAVGAHAAGGAAEAAGRRAVGSPDDRLGDAAGCGASGSQRRVRAGPLTRVHAAAQPVVHDRLW
jgi:hypothetical protein